MHPHDECHYCKELRPSEYRQQLREINQTLTRAKEDLKVTKTFLATGKELNKRLEAVLQASQGAYERRWGVFTYSRTGAPVWNCLRVFCALAVLSVSGVMGLLIWSVVVS